MTGEAHIIDPELVLPSDPVPAGAELVVVAEWAPGFPGRFGGLGELIAARSEYERAASIMVSAAQAAITPPAFVTYSMPVVRAEVYGHVFGADDMARRELDAGHEPAKVERFRQRLAEASKRGWLYGWWVSELDPEGTWQAVHRHRIYREVFSGEYHASRVRLGSPEAGSRFAEGVRS